MKKTILIALYMLITATGFAQDYILSKNGWISVVVVEVTPTAVKYKLYGDQKTIHTGSKSDISEILYQDGRKEIFTETGNQGSSNNQNVDNRQVNSHSNPENTNSKTTYREEIIETESLPLRQKIESPTTYRDEESYQGTTQNYLDIVYTKNGSIIRGTIIELIPNASLRIRTADGSIFAYRMAEVEKITKEAIYQNPKRELYQEPQPRSNSTNAKRRPRGYRGFFELESGFDFGGDGNSTISGLSTSHGAQISPNFYIGAGLGLDYYARWEQILIPLFVDLRFNFLNKPVSPFLDLKIGYSYFDDGSFDLYFHPDFGVSFLLARRFALNLGVGYRLQMAEVKYSGYYYSDSERKDIGGVTFSLGIEF